MGTSRTRSTVSGGTRSDCATSGRQYGSVDQGSGSFLGEITKTPQPPVYQVASIDPFIINHLSAELFASSKYFYEQILADAFGCNILLQRRSARLAKATSVTRPSTNQNIFIPRKIHWGAQNKHIVDTNNYDKKGTKSILTHQDPESLIKKYAGHGRTVNQFTRNWPGYRESVDFEEIVGQYRTKNGDLINTTRGIIHYSGKGMHIVPARPRGYIENE